MTKKRKIWTALAIVAGIIILVLISRVVEHGDSQKVDVAHGFFRV